MLKTIFRFAKAACRVLGLLERACRVVAVVFAMEPVFPILHGTGLER